MVFKILKKKQQKATKIMISYMSISLFHSGFSGFSEFLLHSVYSVFHKLKGPVKGF